MMTGEQKQQIYVSRRKGVPFAEIAAQLGMPRSTVKTFCWRNGLSDAEMAKPQPNRGYRGFCKRCGKLLDQKPDSKPKVFCTDECRILWWKVHPHKLNRKSLQTVKCPYCGDEFTHYPSQKKTFCSHECYIQNRYHREDGHDNAG